MRKSRRIAILATLFLILLAPKASAHNSVTSSSPEEGETFPSRPTSISLTFSKYINPGTASFILYNHEGTAIPFSGEPEFSNNEVELTPPSLDQGSYALIWRSTGADGHEAIGQIVFNVIAPSPNFINPKVDTEIFTFLQFAKIIWYGSVLALFIYLMFRVRFKNVNFIYKKTIIFSLAVAYILKLVAVGSAVSSESILEGLRDVFLTQPNGVGWVLKAILIVSLLFLKDMRKIWFITVLLLASGLLTGHLSSSILSLSLTTIHIFGVFIWSASLYMMIYAINKGIGLETANYLRKIVYTIVPVILATGFLLYLTRTGLNSIFDIYDALKIHDYTKIVFIKIIIVLAFILPIGLIGKILWSKGKGRNAAILEFTGLLVVMILGSSLSTQQPALGKVDSSNITESLFSVPSNYRECVTGPSYNACVERWFMAQVKSVGVKETLEILNEASREDKGVRDNCHGTVHGIGREAYRLLGSVEEAYEQGTGTCGAGFYHGVLEGYSRVSTDTEFKEKMPSICENFNGPMREFCDHGVGHAVILRTNGDADRGREFCQVLEFEKNRFVRCLSGMYMEWGLRYRDAGQAANLDPRAKEGLPYPRVEYALDLCQALERENASYEELFVCYEGAFFGLQTRMYAGLSVMDEATNYCNKRSNRASEACFGGFGGEVYQWVGKDYKAGFDLCNKATKEADRKICVQGYVNGWLFRERNLALAENLCKNYAKNEDLGVCFLAISSYKERAEGFKETDLIDESGNVVVFEDEKASLIS